MSWVRKTPPPSEHECEPPRRNGLLGAVDGQNGDLWRCDDCGDLWRVGLACGPCDRAGGPFEHVGLHVGGRDWRPATWWQRLRHRRAGHDPDLGPPGSFMEQWYDPRILGKGDP